MRVGYANRGRGLEVLIEQANRLYRLKNIAVVQKVATPTKVLQDRYGRTKVVREKSTVDFVGVWRGVALAFDAKQTREKRFPLSQLHEHQYEFLRAWTECGGLAFLLIEVEAMTARARFHILPFRELERYWTRWKSGGRASLSAEELNALPRVRPGRGVALDYLATLEEMMADEPRDEAATRKRTPAVLDPARI